MFELKVLFFENNDIIKVIWTSDETRFLRAAAAVSSLSPGAVLNTNYHSVSSENS
jgi:hypothetical protein